MIDKDSERNIEKENQIERESERDRAIEREIERRESQETGLGPRSRPRKRKVSET